MAKSSNRTAQMAADAGDGVVIEGTSGRADNPLIPLDDIDTEESWDQWIEDLKGSEATGTVQVYKLPIDAEGNPNMAKGARQIFLMSCPHQQYGFDELITIVKTKFMLPGELATIRITGRRSGARGVMFNRIVPVQRESGAAPGNASEGGGNVLGVIQAMQNQTQRTAEMMERILAGGRDPQIPPPKPASETVKEWLAILSPMIAPALLALINRPAPKSDIEGLIGAMVKLKDLTGDGGGGNGEDENTTLGIVKAVAGPGLQLLNTLAQNRQPAGVPQIPGPRRVRPIPQSTATPQAIPVRPPVGGGTSGEPTTPPNPPPGTSSVPAPSIESDKMLAQLAPQLDQLATLAEQGAEPAEVAKLVMDMLPQNEEVDQQLYGIVADEKSFNRLMILAPRMKTHAEWFEKLRVALLAEFEEEK